MTRIYSASDSVRARRDYLRRLCTDDAVAVFMNCNFNDGKGLEILKKAQELSLSRGRTRVHLEDMEDVIDGRF